MLRTYTRKITITAGQTSKEEEFNLPSEFESVVGYGIPASQNSADPLHSQPFSVSVYSNGENRQIQDETNGNDYMFTPSVPASDRYKKTKFRAGSHKVKLVARIPAAIGTDFSFDFVFALQ